MNYSIKVKCSNCGFSEDVEIPEGLEVSEMPCPECRTKSLKKEAEPKKEKEEIKPD